MRENEDSSKGVDRAFGAFEVLSIFGEDEVITEYEPHIEVVPPTIQSRRVASTKSKAN
jgi:hypothetical protein